ncbi:MAG: hypothetical protein KBONHNOK_00943 [Candidatus Methanoperedenaceae archaeon GB50]|nr:MAG: hypothetical protein KBONHNOK_00943 [Candidatus Methanoperedenaceae archaeon GB50]
MNNERQITERIWLHLMPRLNPRQDFRHAWDVIGNVREVKIDSIIIVHPKITS